MMTLVQVVTVLSLAICLAAAVFRFIGLASHTDYSIVLAAASVIYFVAATAWAERRR